MDTLHLIIVFLLGLSIGSFIANYSYRVTRNISIVKGRSSCDNCKSEILWYDNIPIVSYIILGGKCRNCHEKISRRYPIIELISGLGITLIYQITQHCDVLFKNELLCRIHTELGLISPLFIFIVFSLLLLIFITDFEHNIIPDEFVFWGIITTSIYVTISQSPIFYLNFLTGLISATFFLILNLITKGKGMGLGDVKLAVFLGMLLGWPHTLTWLMLSFVTGAVFGVLLILFGKAKFGKQIAFGPYLIASAFFVLLFGESIKTFLYFI